MVTRIPEHVLRDDRLSGRVQVVLAEVLDSWSMDESDWKKFALVHGHPEIVDHERFLRSKKWSDPDHQGLVLDLIQNIFGSDDEAFFDLFDRDWVQRRLREVHPDLMAAWDGEEDPVLEALTHSVEEMEAADDVSFKAHSARIRQSLPGDPEAAIGATKDLLEAVMRTILHRRGHDVDTVAGFDFPTLMARCFHELGMNPSTPPSSPVEGQVRKFASQAKKMMEAANEFRNVAGTGHGRVAGSHPDVEPEDAAMVASSGLVLAAWMLRRSQRSR